MRRWPSGSSPRRGRCTSTKNWGDLTNTVRPGLDDHRSVPVGRFRPAGHRQPSYSRRDGKLTDVVRLDWAAAGLEPSTSGATGRLYVLHQAGASRSRVPSRTSSSSRLFGADGSSTGIICDQTISLDGFYTRQDTPNFCGASASSPESGWSSSPTTSRFRPPHLRLYKSRWQVELLLQVDQAASSDQAVYGTSEKRTFACDADLDCRLGLRPRRHCQEAPRPGRLALHFVTRKSHTSSTCGRQNRCNASQITNQLNLFDFGNRTLIAPRDDQNVNQEFTIIHFVTL